MIEYIITDEDIAFIRENIEKMTKLSKESRDLALELANEVERLHAENRLLREERNNLMDGVAALNDFIEERDTKLAELERRVGDAGRLQGIG